MSCELWVFLSLPGENRHYSRPCVSDGNISLILLDGFSPRLGQFPCSDQCFSKYLRTPLQISMVSPWAALLSGSLSYDSSRLALPGLSSISSPQAICWAVPGFPFSAPWLGNSQDSKLWQSIEGFSTFASCLTVIHCMMSSILETVVSCTLFCLIWLIQTGGKSGAYYFALRGSRNPA